LRGAAVAFQSGDTTNAIRLYREFLKDYPDAAEIRSNLGAALVKDGQLAEAITEYQAALEKMPANPRVRMNLALAYYKFGWLPEAIKELETLYGMQPLEINPGLLLADCLMQTGNPEKAVELLTPLRTEYPDNTAVIYLLGMSHLRLNQTKEAQELLDQILRSGESAESAFLLGQSAYMRNEVMTAAGYLARAVQLNPNMPGVHSLYGQVLKTIGKTDEAFEEFKAELKVNAYDFVANMELAVLLKKEGNLEESQKYLARALQVRPADPGALFQRATILSSQGQFDDARTQLEQLVKDFPDFNEAHIALATIYYRQKRTADGDRERALGRRTPQDNAESPAPSK